ncbi:retrovirus-related pol polyprotein from transposon TNT 1-94 [Tanacetum coccineum]
MNHQTSSVLQIAYQSPQVTTQPITESSLVDSGFLVPVFSPGDDPIACLNKAMAFLTAIASSSNATSSRGNNANGQVRVVKCYNCQGEGHMARQCTQPKRPRNSAWYKDKAMLAEAQEAGQILDEEKLAFLADLGVLDGQAIQTIIPNNAAFQNEDLDTYDSGCDGISNAKVILMANISDYESDIISEVSHSKTYLNDMENQSVHAMQDIELTLAVDFIDNEIYSDSNIIPYSQYLQETQQANEKANKEQNSESLTAELERYKERVKTFEERLNIDLSNREKMIDSQMDDMIKEKLLLKEQVDSLEKNLSKQIKEKECLLQSDDFGKHFTPQQELSAEQAFWLHMCNPTSKPSDASSVRIEAPKELLKVILVNESLENLKFHLARFDNVVKIRTTPDARTEGFFENNDLKAQLQDKDSTICKLKDIIKSMREKSKEENVKYDYCEIETKNVELENKNKDLKAQIQDKVFVITLLKNDLRKVKGKEIIDIAAQIPSANTIVPGMFKLDLEPLASSRKPKNVKNVGSSKKAKIVEFKNATDIPSSWGSNATDIPSSSLVMIGIVRFGNDHIGRIIGYGDYQLGNVTISRVYYVEGLGHNLFSVGQFCDADLEVAFRKNTCFIRNLEGVNLLSGSRDTNLYTISLDDMLTTSPICLLSKASKTKSWLWHHWLSHLNFACALGKSKKSSHQPKANDTNQEKLYLLHMDLYSPMRVVSINGKRFGYLKHYALLVLCSIFLKQLAINSGVVSPLATRKVHVHG